MPTRQDRAQIRAVVTGLERVSETVVKDLTLTAHSELVRVSPVDTGNFAANWLVRVGTPSEQVFDARTNKGPASAAVARGVASVARYRLARGAVYITNNTSYGEILNSGSSSQEPAGFVQRSIARAIQLVSRRRIF